MKPFVPLGSVVRSIWGKSDTVLLIFAGAAAEFALNKAVDWLYFTGKLPADPIGRLFSTVSYARKIVFSSEEDALEAIDQISCIHQAVEKSRGYRIPDWAYRDVLYMLIYYSIAAFELLERPLSEAEKEDVYDVFYRMGNRMGLKQLPNSYTEWLTDRQRHLFEDLQHHAYTDDLFLQYRKHLGSYRYHILVEAQKLLVPEQVSRLLRFGNVHWLYPLVPVYRLSKNIRLEKTIKSLLLPQAYKERIYALDALS
jgi:hypothetical protein